MTTIWNEEELKILDEKSKEYNYELAGNYPTGAKIFEGTILNLERHQLNNGKKPVITVQNTHKITEYNIYKEVRYFVLNQTQQKQIRELKTKSIKVETAIINIAGQSKNTFVFSDL